MNKTRFPPWPIFEADELAAVDAVKRLKELERENGRLKRLVADQALDIQILKEVAKGEF